ncbi:MAG: FG-GAP-like repeat-containing protein [Candidatus Sumerlaeota bacterium]|nr:FG-GAP-like repeat-containing protein [Candidatus Sumerlaeota bacterium]
MIQKRFLFAVAAVLVCAGGALAASPLWERVYTGVRDGASRMLYAGSCDWSAPAFVDIDGDGDLDLFIGQNNGYPMCFRNDGTNEIPQWTFVAQEYPFPALSSNPGNTAPAFADIDADGDMDMALGLANGNVAFYRNIGTRYVPVWNLASEDWTGVAVTGNARPVFADIDGDGLIDLFVGGSDGHIAYFKNIGTRQTPVWPNPIDVVTQFQNLNVGGAASPFFADIDGNGTLDLFVGNAVGEVRIYRNFGTPVSFAFTSAPIAIIPASKNAAPVLADLDHNGTLDLFIGSLNGPIMMLRNLGTAQAPQWDAPLPVWHSLDAGMEASAALADIDGDGVPELFIAATDSTATGGAVIQFYRNAGTPWMPDWRLASPQLSGIAIPQAKICFGEVNSDNNPALFVGSLDGNVYMFQNTGTPQDPVYSNPTTVVVTGGNWAKPSLADVDGDGKLDLWVSYTDLFVGHVELYRNIGTPLVPDWSGVPEDYSATLAVGMIPSIAAGDVDGDGLPDAICSDEMGQTYFFACLQTTPTLLFGAGELLTGIGADVMSAPYLADIDGDLHPDLIFGSGYGGVHVYRNATPDLIVTPHHKTVLSGSSIAFATSPSQLGDWDIIADRSGGSAISPGGLYTAGASAGVDTIRFNAGGGSWGVAYVNVVSAAQSAGAGKAVILAGRKTGDPLWNTTNDLANSIYRTLLLRGFTKANIYYLSPATNQDSDGNGLNDDVRAASSLANAQYALTTWAKGAGKLFVYLIDHGDEEGAQAFIRCNESDVLYASVLEGWLNALQTSGTAQLALAVDCCRSGGFLPRCAPPAGFNRVTIASCASDEPAFFSAGGLLSFTNGFIGALGRGRTLGDAFTMASEATLSFQHPQMDDNGDGVYDAASDGALAKTWTVGAAATAGADRPQIGIVSGNQALAAGQTTATIWASGITSRHPITRVWACLAAPSLIPNARARASTPVISLQEAELIWSAGNQRYEAAVSGLSESGAFLVRFNARDIWGVVSEPKQTYLFQRRIEEQFIIVCGDGAYSPGTPYPWSDEMARAANLTARARWIPDDDILYFSSSTDTLKDGAPTRANLQTAIANATTAAQLTVYLVGKGDATAFDIDGDAVPSDLDDVTPADLKGWLDTLQTASPTRVIVILDFASAGEWTAALAPAPVGRERIVLTSCGPGEQSRFGANGLISFSNFFFSRIFLGRSVGDAFNWARAAVRASSGDAVAPRLDDNGDGVGDKHDGAVALVTYIGVASGDFSAPPVIGAYASDVVLTGTSALLWAAGVWSAQGIDQVYAQIILPGLTPPEDVITRVNLALSSGTAQSRWEYLYTGFDPSKTYTVIYFASSLNGAISQPYVTHFGPTAVGGPDVYDLLYGDNTPASLNFVTDDQSTQTHNFWSQGDVDWALFNADAGRHYTIRVSAQGPRCDALIKLFNPSDLGSPLVTRDDSYAGGADEIIEWDSGASSRTMYVMVTQSPDAADVHGAGTSYLLTISGNWGDNAGLSTLSPTQVGNIGKGGGSLKAGAGGLYTQSAFNVPPNALDNDMQFGLSGPGDVSNAPYFSYTTLWLSAHPNSANITQILTTSGITFNVPATVTVEFTNNGTFFAGFPVKDIPDGYTWSQMRLYKWSGSEWSLVPGLQTVTTNTVTALINRVGEYGNDSGLFISLFAAAPASGPTPSPSPSPSPTNHPSPTPPHSPTPSPTPPHSPTPSPTPSPSPSPTPVPKGTVIVLVKPSVASWSFQDGSGGTHIGMNSQTLINIPAGLITMTWQPLSGFDRPATNPMTLLLSNGGTVTFNGNYTLPRTLLYDYLTGRMDTLTPHQREAADINGDGRIDIADLMALIQRPSSDIVLKPQ